MRGANPHDAAALEGRLANLDQLLKLEEEQALKSDQRVSELARESRELRQDAGE